jgi:excisionase family DNA binding protein
VTGQPITLDAEGLVAILASLPDHALAPLASRFAELTACRTDPPGRFLTVEEAAEIIRAPVSFIYNARSDGRLTPHKRGSRALVDRAELEGLIRT